MSICSSLVAKTTGEELLFYALTSSRRTIRA
jgi:hypothetical protein